MGSDPFIHFLRGVYTGSDPNGDPIWVRIADPNGFGSVESRVNVIVGDTWYSPYCLLALSSTQLDRQSATGTMNACASANDSRRVFAENHSSWEGQM